MFKLCTGCIDTHIAPHTLKRHLRIKRNQVVNVTKKILA